MIAAVLVPVIMIKGIQRNTLHSNVKIGKSPFEENARKLWTKQVLKGRKYWEPGLYTNVCCNHFVDGKPTKDYPIPTLFMSGPADAKTPTKKIKSPRKRKPDVATSSRISLFTIDDVEEELETQDMETDQAKSVSSQTDVAVLPLVFTQFTREGDVKFHTGFESTEMFKIVFEFVKVKASVMTYWDGNKKTLILRKQSSSSDLDMLLASPEYNIVPLKPGPSRKLSLEQEFLMTMMRLRLGILTEDIAFRFQVSPGKVSQILITWIKLLSKESACLIVLPSKFQVRATLPDCFKRLYPKCRMIIDCTEVFMETPSSLEVQALLWWSDYKSHCTVKFLIAITPNGATCWISPLYGGRTTDIHIVRNSGFLKIPQPGYQKMADRGFKIRTNLAMYQCTLCIPPSAAKGTQMTSSAVKEMSNVANVRIYVEQAIKRMKDYRILKTQQPLL